MLDGVVSAVVERCRADKPFRAWLRVRLAGAEDALLAAMPDLLGVLDRSAAPRSLGEEQHGEVRTIRALAELLDCLGSRDRPALIMLDDCQWADELTIKLLVHWNRGDRTRDASTRVLVVVAFRTEEVPANHPLRALKATDHVVLASLQPAAVRDLVQSMAGAVPREAVELIVRLSEGSPFMAIEVLRGLIETGALVADDRGWQIVPQLIADVQASSRSAVVFSRRLEQTSGDVLDLLCIGAVLGKQFSLELATRLAGQNAPQALAAVAEARRRNIVWADDRGDRCAFVHDRLREALLDRLPQARRRALHRLAAISIEQRDDDLNFELAYHFDAAGEYARALPYALGAAATARSRYALEIAQLQYEIAARGAAAPALQRVIAEGLGDVAMLRGHYDDASAHFAAAGDLCDSDLLAAGIQGKLGELAFKRGDVRRASELLVRALRLLGQRVPRSTPEFVVMLAWQVVVQVAHSVAPRIFLARRALDTAQGERLAIRLHSALAHAYWFGSGLVPCGWTHLRGLNLAERYPPSSELAKAYSEHAPVITMVPWCRRGIVYAQKSLTIRRDLEDTWGEGQSLNFYGVVLYAAGRFEEVLEKCGAAVEILERTGDQWEVNTANWNIALALYRLGRMEEAISVARRVHGAGVALGDGQASGISLGAWAKASGGAIPWNVIETELARPADDVHTRVEVLQAQALRLISDDRIDDAVEVLTGADRYLRQSGLRQEYVAPVRPWLVTALRLQLERTSCLAPAKRRRLARQARRAARRARWLATSYRNNLPHALRESALLAAIGGRPRRARRLLQRSLAVASAQGARDEHAQTLTAWTTIDAALGRRGATAPVQDTEAGSESARGAECVVADTAIADAVPDVTLSLADRFATVLDAGRRIASALPEDAVFAAVCEAAATLLHGEHSSVIALDEHGRPRRDPGDAEVPADYSNAVIERAWRTGATVVLTQEDLQVNASDSLELGGMRSVLCAPIFKRGRATACLYVTHDQFGGLFAEEEDRLAGFIATLAGAALENAEGFSEVQALSASLEQRVAERTAQLIAAKKHVEEAQAVGGFGSWEWDIATGTIEWSEQLCRIYGVKSGGQRTFEEFLDLAHPDDRARIQATVQTAYETHQPYALEHRIVRPDGLVRVIHGRGEVLSDDAGRPLRMLGTGQDITDQKAAQETRARLAALVDCSEDAIVAESPDGLIESWNRGARELFGYSAEDVLGEPTTMLVAADRQDELAQLLAHIKRGERVEALETVRIAKDGRAIDVSLRISLVYDDEGELVGVSSILRDITPQKRLEAQLRRSSRHFDLSRDLTASVSFEGYFKSVNPALAHILGWSQEEFLARPVIDTLHPDDHAITRAEVDRLAAGHVTTSFVTRFQTRDGSYRWLDWNAMVPPDEALIYASGRDITERVQMEAALHDAELRFRTAFDQAPIGVCLLSLDPRDPGRLLQVNPALAEIVGSNVEELTGAPLSSLTHPEDHGDIYMGLSALTHGHSGHVEFEKRFMHSDGHPVWTLISAASLADDDGKHTLAVTHVMDISARKQAESQLQHLADHDALTGLFNRRRFSEELERALRHAKRFDEGGAVLFLDLDGFKFVNDTLGHAAGDELIARVAGLLGGVVRETDTLARVGGDEFAVLLVRCDETAAVHVAEKLLVALRDNGLANRDARRGHVSSSIGIAVFRGHEELSADELVVEADIAMYDAKEAGKDRYSVYDRTEGRRALMSMRHSWNDRLRRALSDDSFVLHAQPITATRADATPWFELLLRLPDGHGDLIPPGTFLYNAERFGLIKQIDRWVLSQAVRHLHDSHAAGSDLMLSVNVSGTTMGDPELAAHVATLLSTYPIPTDRLVIEITETAAISNIEHARILAQQLRTLGCKLALDDFGAGFASFYYLKHLQFDYLKIDGEFIRNLCATPTDQLVVKAIVTIAHGLDTRTIAEFVGDDATAERLKELEVDYAQGYHLGRPSPVDQAFTYLTASRPTS